MTAIGPLLESVEMSDVKWFVANVRSCQERQVAEQLGRHGIEAYVPVQKVQKQWSDRVKIVDKMVFPRMVFIHTTETERKKTFAMTYGITSYMVDRTSTEHKVLVVPDRQMEDFVRVVNVMNGDGDITVAYNNIRKGDMVRIIRGPLKDFVCECVEIRNQHKIIIRMGMLGSVLSTISASDVVKE